MPRGRKKKFRLDFNIKTETIRSILALLLVLLAILSFISFFAPDYSLNSRIQGVLRGLFGFPSILMVFILAISGLLLIQSLELRIKEPRILFGVTLMMVSLSTLMHSFVADDKAEEFAKAGKAGGAVGHLVSNFLVDSISIWGSVAVVVILLIISFIMVFDISFEQMISFARLVGEKFNIPFLTKKDEDDEDEEEDKVEVETGVVEPSKPEDFEQDDDDYGGESVIEVVSGMSEPFTGEEARVTGMSSIAPSSPKLPYSDKVWELPSIQLLDEPVINSSDTSNQDNERKKIIKDTLKSFDINVEVVDFKKGPTVTQYILKADTGVRVGKITNLHSNLALALKSPNGEVRIEAPIPGTSYIGIEVPNVDIDRVYFKQVITSDQMKTLKSKVGIVLGKDVSGVTYTRDIGGMPHLLIAGTTGSGKSIFIHNILFSILYRASPSEVRFILVDPKKVELNKYDGMPHLIAPVVTDLSKAPSVFKWAVAEMQRRYDLFNSTKTRNINEFNEKSGIQVLPYIVIIVDEFANIMMQDPQGVEKSIIKLAQLARATGIHMVLAVQNPSADVLTGQIKANIPARVAFNVLNNTYSRIIIDQSGAEKLLGKGDMLFVPPDAPRPTRLQGSFIDNGEIDRLVDFLKGQGVEPDYKEDVLEMMEKSGKGPSSDYAATDAEVDELFDEAVEIVVTNKKASTSLLQRKLSIGYARAAKIIDQLQDHGIVSAPDGNKPRDVLLDSLPGDELMDIAKEVEMIEPEIETEKSDTESVDTLQEEE
jgi:S-DNA-T family DNA segregation ATPase FtsK/SpoIIIE